MRGAGWVLVVAVVWLLLPPQYGGKLGTTVVSGHSMEPTHWTGDLVLTWAGTDVSPGDVVVYRVPDGEPGEGLHVVHRVVDVDAAGRFTMLGDNNDEPDLWTPTAADVVGEVKAAVPQGGRWMALLLSPLALALLCGVLVTLAIVTEDRDTPRGPRGRRDPPDQHDLDPPDASDPPRVRTPPSPEEPGARPSTAGPRRPALLGLVGLALLVASLPAASASTLGGLRSSQLTAAGSSTPPVQPVAAEGDVAVRITSATNASYCAEVTVSTTAGTPVRWSARITPARTSSNPLYRLDAAPTTVAGARTTSFSPASGTWVVSGDGTNDVITRSTPTTWTFCSPWSTAPTPSSSTSVAVEVTSQSGAGANAPYCAQVTVTTTAPDWVRWQATVSSRTPNVTGSRYRLNEPPTLTDATQTALTTGGSWSLTVRGGPAQAAVKAGSPATWSYCKG